MHESRNKMQPEISLGTPPWFSEERVIITVGATLFGTRWLMRGDQKDGRRCDFRRLERVIFF